MQVITTWVQKAKPLLGGKGRRQRKEKRMRKKHIYLGAWEKGRMSFATRRGYWYHRL